MKDYLKTGKALIDKNEKEVAETRTILESIEDELTTARSKRDQMLDRNDLAAFKEASIELEFLEGRAARTLPELESKLKNLSQYPLMTEEEYQELIEDTNKAAAELQQKTIKKAAAAWQEIKAAAAELEKGLKDLTDVQEFYTYKIMRKRETERGIEGSTAYYTDVKLQNWIEYAIHGQRGTPMLPALRDIGELLEG